jgi:hypothetical protein
MYDPVDKIASEAKNGQEVCFKTEEEDHDQKERIEVKHAYRCGEYGSPMEIIRRAFRFCRRGRGS